MIQTVLNKLLGFATGNAFNYIKIGLAIAFLCGVFYFGWHTRDRDFIAYKVDQQQKVQELQDKHQAQTDQIRKDKNEQINAINAKLFATLNELRSRPSRTEAASNGQGFTGRTGLSLFAEDSAFLVGEAARADKLRIELKACYAQYDAISK